MSAAPSTEINLIFEQLQGIKRDKLLALRMEREELLRKLDEANKRLKLVDQCIRREALIRREVGR